MNPRRRRRLRNQRQDRKRFHELLIAEKKKVKDSRRAQQDKAARDAEQKLGPGYQVIPAYAVQELSRTYSTNRTSTRHQPLMRLVETFQVKLYNSRQRELEAFQRRMVEPSGWAKP